MNLLSHFYCAQGNSSAFQAGGASADLLPLYRRRLKVFPLWRQWKAAPEGPLVGFLEGMAYHFQVDSVFHVHRLFLDLSQPLRQIWGRAGGPPGVKFYFAAHLLAEIHLDRLLLQRAFLSDAFYEMLNEQQETIIRFALANPQADRSSLKDFLGLVRKERFLEDYRTWEGCFYRLNRVLGSRRQRPLEPQEQTAAREWLEKGEDAAWAALTAFRDNLPALLAAQRVTTSSYE
ncbi:MAG: hypothetical protein OEV94_07475 [Deltaproteobacteria bacterium]|nr:hypothetical protein [Deltaproteobacteria bacterium]